MRSCKVDSPAGSVAWLVMTGGPADFVAFLRYLQLPCDLRSGSDAPLLAWEEIAAAEQ